MENMKNKVHIIDSTLRDGEQAPGVVFTYEDKLRIAEHLSLIGVDEIEAGTPAVGDQERKVIHDICRKNLNSDVSVWCRAMESDIGLAAECGVPVLHISFPLSKIQLNAMGKSLSWVFSTLKRLIKKSGKEFDFISIGIQDALRCDKNVLFDFILCAEANGADRVRLADSIGIGTPLAVYRLFRDIKKTNTHIKVGFHGHNDLGMATGNSIAAIEGGADTIDVTVNGLGERCGNAALEEISVALGFSELHYCDIECASLTQICEYVSAASKRIIPDYKPITGNNIFTHESGTHLCSLFNNPLSYQPFLPEDIGKKGMKIIAGKHSGSKAVKKIFSNIGIYINSEQAFYITRLVKTKSIEQKRSLSEEELKNIYQECFG